MLLMLTDEAYQMIAAEAEQADWENSLQRASANPTVKTLTDLLSFPSRVEKIEEAWNAYRDDQRSRNIKDAVQLASMLNNGKLAFAESFLRDRATALRKGPRNGSVLSTVSRHPPENPNHTLALVRALKSRDPQQIKGVRAFAGMAVAFAVDPEEAADALARVGFKDDRSAAEKKRDQPPPSRESVPVADGSAPANAEEGY